ncbi:hypothetical protein [Polaromonas sp. SM01]|uniref:hypothetical protein n=1 Tax=Polaromonas sp. SM01 TaxID=3085630 RepID=UPI00298276CC|nr:hypothetical protein [Polaromonas sp. SM01]MDW5442645.1 hypothetical protein [Polaromonas sp. SM01]
MIFSARSWHVLAGWLLAGVSCAASAQALMPPGVHLGMSVAELREAVPGLHAVRRPQTVSGTVGSWRVSGVQQGGYVLEETFFFAQQSLQRVELLLQPDINPPPDDAFAKLVVSLRAEYGPELPLYGGLSGAVAGSASWVHEGMDILAMSSGPPGQAKTRLIYKTRILKDASEL